MPRVRYIIILLFATSFFLVCDQSASAASQLSYAEAAVSGDQRFALPTDGLSLTIPAGSLERSSRVSLQSITDTVQLPADAASPVYVWQVLDSGLAKPLRLAVPRPAGEGIVIVRYRSSSDSPWSETGFTESGEELQVDISSAYGQVYVMFMALQPFAITLDDATVSKGYPIATPDGHFHFYILPDAFTRAATFTITPLSASVYVPPAGLHVVSPIYHFKIDSGQTGPLPSDLPIDIKFFGSNTQSKDIYYWNNLTSAWEPSPSLTRYEDQAVRTLTHQQEMILAVFSRDIMEKGKASWYRYKNGDFAASPDYAKGSRLKVTNLANGKSVVVTINDYGPDRSVHPDRVIDLDRVAFQKIASPSVGVIEVSVEENYF